MTNANDRETMEIQVYFEDNTCLDEFHKAVAEYEENGDAVGSFVIKISRAHEVPRFQSRLGSRLGRPEILQHLPSFIVIGFDEDVDALATLEILKDPSAIWADKFYSMDYKTLVKYSELHN